MIAATSATIIAFAALAVSIWQGYTTRKHNELSVEPILHFKSGTLTNYDSISTYSIKVQNEGLGPAIIDDIKLFYKNNEITVDRYKIHYSSLITIAADLATYKENIHREINGNSLSRESVILPGNEIELLSFKFEEANSIKRENITSNLYDINVEITYTSIYRNRKKNIQLLSEDQASFPPLTNENIQEIRKNYPE